MIHSKSSFITPQHLNISYVPLICDDKPIIGRQSTLLHIDDFTSTVTNKYCLTLIINDDAPDTISLTIHYPSASITS